MVINRTKLPSADMPKYLDRRHSELQELFVCLEQSQTQRGIAENYISVTIKDLKTVAQLGPHLGNGLEDFEGSLSKLQAKLWLGAAGIEDTHGTILHAPSFSETKSLFGCKITYLKPQDDQTPYAKLLQVGQSSHSQKPNKSFDLDKMWLEAAEDTRDAFILCLCNHRVYRLDELLRGFVFHNQLEIFPRQFLFAVSQRVLPSLFPT